MSDGAKAEAKHWLTPTAALRRYNQMRRTRSSEESAPGWRPLRYGFQIGPLCLMVGPDVLTEVLPGVPVYPLPGAPRWMAGLMNLRGNLVPVFDLHRFFALGTNQQATHHLLALDHGAAAVAFYVDGLPERVATSRPLRTLPPLPAPLKNHAGRAFAGDGSVWTEFCHSSFFKSLSAAGISQL